MRLRKYAKIPDVYVASPFSPPIILRTQCQLNQNPWDVMSLSSSSSPLPSPPSSQVNKITSFWIDDNPMCPMEVVEREEFNDNGGKWEHQGDGSIADKAEQPTESLTSLCSKIDVECWDEEAVVRNSMLEHHLSIPKTYNNSSLPAIKKQVSATLRQRPHRAKASRSSLNFNDFYYYSGFGPHWSKSNEVSQYNSGNMKKHVQNEQKLEHLPSPQVVDNDFDYVEIEEAGADGEKNGKKRARKPIKARSLKSLM